MKPLTLLLTACILLITAALSHAQEVTEEPPTPTPEITATPAASQIVVTTIDPNGDGNGQLVLVDYTVSAGESIIAVLLVTLLLSLWGIFLFAVLRERTGRHEL